MHEDGLMSRRIPKITWIRGGPRELPSRMNYIDGNANANF